MSYIVFDKKVERSLRFDTFVRDLDIITTADPVMSVRSATTFDSPEDANEYMQRLQQCGTYDITDCEVRALEDMTKAEDDANIKYEAQQRKAAWDNTDKETKRSILRKMLKQEGQEAVDKWLAGLEDNSGITPMTDDEFIDRKVNEIESKYGIRVTDKQRDQLFKKFVEGEQPNG